MYHARDLTLRASLLLGALSCLLTACTAPTRHHAAPGALGPYSGAVESGELVYVSGKIGDRSGSFEREVETAIDAVEAELASLGLTLSHVVQSTCFLTDMERYADFNAVYGARFRAPYPARACVAVAALPAGARCELLCVARRAGH